MKSLLLYLLQVVIASGILYGYYYLMLRNRKFHQYNRFYLLAAVCISILVPFLNVPVYFTENEIQSSVVVKTLQHISLLSPENETTVITTSYPVTTAPFNWNTILYTMYVLAVILLLWRIFLSLRKLKTIIKNNRVEELEGVRFVNTTEPGTPYSFFRWLIWNKKIELRSAKGEQIFRHEIFHIQEKHSLDIVGMELVAAFFWINPFFHLIKKELKTIHEFLADRFAVNENEMWQYAELLIMQALNTQQRLVNPFFHNQIKRRIAMITNPQKTSYQYLRKLLVLPVAAMVVTLFAFSYKNRNAKPVFTGPPEPITIVLDAGHGGIDPGARSYDQKYTEAKLALAIAKEIQKLSGEYKVNVVMTREDDHLPGNASTKANGLKKRVEISETIKPYAFISIHLNAADANLPARKGFEAYIAGQRDDPGAKLLASAILQNISSIYLVNDKPLQRHETGIYVLDNNKYPSLILQCGYITNPDDVDFIIKPENQEKLARSILTALVSYKKESLNENPITRDTIPGQAARNNLKTDSTINRKVVTRSLDSTSRGTEMLPKPLVVIDGVVVGNLSTYDLSKKITVEQIQSLNVLKNTAATAKYGDKAKDGVIEIITKSRKSPEIKDLTLKEVSPRNDDNIIFEKLEIEPAFPGGEAEWKRYLAVNFNPDVPITHNAPAGEYTTYIRFVVHKDGSISDLKPLTNHGFGMEEEAMRLIRKGPKWVPGMQNGRAVNAYKKQAVTFKVEEVNAGKPMTSKSLPEIFIVAYVSPEAKNQKTSSASIPDLQPTSIGSSAWRKFFERNLDPNTPIREGWIVGTYRILLQFTQNEDGTISGVTSLNYQNSKTAEHCIDLVKHIPKMLRAKENDGIKKVHFVQPLTFIIEKDPDQPSVYLFNKDEKQKLKLTEVQKLTGLKLFNPKKNLEAEIASFRITLDNKQGINELINISERFNSDVRTAFTRIQPPAYISIEDIWIKAGNEMKKPDPQLYMAL